MTDDRPNPDERLKQSDEIDASVIRDDHTDEAVPRGRSRVAGTPPSKIDWGDYLRTALVVAACGLVGWSFVGLRLDETNIVMVFLLGVAIVAAWLGRGPAIAAAVASVLVFDFCFIPPYFSFAVSDAQYVLTFAVMLGIGLLISTLTSRVQQQLQLSRQQERRTAALYRLTRQLSELVGSDFLVQTAGRQLAEMFSGEVVILLRIENGVELRFGQQTSIAALPVNTVVAQWVAEHSQLAGAGTDTLPNATALFVPLVGSQQTVGAVGVKSTDADRFLDPEQRRLLETCASLIALAVERDQSVLEAQQAQVEVQTEQLRSSLLSSVSHDLRTPLATIAGTASSLLESSSIPDPAQRELLQTMVDESHRMTRLVDNLLEMTRLESGPVVLNKQWHVLEEIVGSALARVRRELAKQTVRVDLPRDLPLVSLDGLLFEQVLVNLLENAARYTPAGSLVEISARQAAKQIEIRVADTGPGLPPGSESRVFEKFFRAATHTPDGRRGVGLGLAICQQIVRAHGGSITAHNRSSERDGDSRRFVAGEIDSTTPVASAIPLKVSDIDRSTGGAEFLIILPCAESAPTVTLDAPLVSSET
ncbi:MAG: DUF4118 domain-containing protein [Planctomycetaceae bacterium]|nr:DUF4118 domain-containing protein [Planctomycetaceae bacterium]